MSALDREAEERDQQESSSAAATDEARVEIRAFDDVVDVIRDRLDELGWTLEELASRAGLNAASLRRLLTSSSANPTFATTMSIAGALGLRIEMGDAVTAEQLLAAD